MRLALWLLRVEEARAGGVDEATCEAMEWEFRYLDAKWRFA